MLVSHPPRATKAPSLGLAFASAALALAVGFLPAALTFGLDPTAASRLGMSDVRVPLWVFVAVWSIIYPGMGLTAWSLTGQLDERSPATHTPFAILGASFLISLTFWLTNSLRMTATLDAINALLAFTTLWVVSRYSTRAARFLIPYAAWMPITLLIKLIAIERGGA